MEFVRICRNRHGPFPDRLVDCPECLLPLGPAMEEVAALAALARPEGGPLTARLTFPWGESVEVAGDLNLGVDSDFSPHYAERIRKHFDPSDPPDTQYFVSRAHAVVRFLRGRLTIRDLDSTNHVLVNGSKISPNIDHPLVDGDRVSLSRHFAFEVSLK